MQLTEELKQLIQIELLSRRQVQREQQQQEEQKEEQIKALIAQHCILSEGGYISREEWQDFCFRSLTGRTCHTNIPFSTYLNNLMPKLGYPLGYAHTKLHVYRGLRWKSKA